MIRTVAAQPHALLLAASLCAGPLAGACGDEAPLYFGQTGLDTGADTGTDIAADSGVDAEGDLPVVDVSTDSSADTGPDVGPDAMPDATGTPAVGGVTVFEVRSPAVDALNTGGVAAGFSPPRETTAPDAVVGACEIRPTGSASDLFAPGNTLDAGPISVAVGAGTYMLTIADDGEGPRYQADDPGDGIEYFTAGDAISAAITGGVDLPATTLELVAPAEPVISEPAWSMMDSHDRDEPLEVRWQGAESGTSIVINILPVTIFPEPGIAEGSSITCAVADTGAFTVPAEALAYLPEGGGLGGGSVALTVARLRNAERVVGSATITLNATASHTIVGAVR